MLDDLERALAAAEEHEEAKLEEGVRLVHRELAEALAREGLAEIETNGRFDPHVHEALLSQPSDREEGSVIEVVQKGYKLGDRVVRPARVVVAAAPFAGGRWRPLGPLRDARRLEECEPGRDQEGLPQARAAAPPGREPGRQRGRGALQGGAARLRRALRPGEAQAVRPLRRGERRGRGPGGYTFTEGFDLGDLGDLGDIFGGLFGARGRQQQQQRGQRGRDIEVEVRLSFEDSLKGVQTTIPVELETACRECGGSGAKPGTAPTICPECHGRGVKAESQGLFALSQPCPRCRGNGTVIEDPCPRCHGTGRERRTKRYTVKIPAGVKDGSRIRLRGKGEAGLRRRRGGRPLRRHARRTLEAVHEARRRPDRRRARHVSRSRARRDRRGSDPRRAGDRQGQAGHDRRHAAPRKGQGRAEAQGLRPRRPARAREADRAEEAEQGRARAVEALQKASRENPREGLGE